MTPDLTHWRLPTVPVIVLCASIAPDPASASAADLALRPIVEIIDEAKAASPGGTLTKEGAVHLKADLWPRCMALQQAVVRSGCIGLPGGCAEADKTFSDDWESRILRAWMVLQRLGMPVADIQKEITTLQMMRALSDNLVVVYDDLIAGMGPPEPRNSQRQLVDSDLSICPNLDKALGM